MATTFQYPGTWSLEVGSTRNSSDATPHTLFVVSVRHNEKLWTVERRFSDFDTLREKLSEFMSSLPALPPKTMLRSMDPAFVKTRQQQLHQWMTDMMKLPAVANSSEFLKFIQAEENTQLGESTAPKMIKVIADPQFGINDFVYDEKQGVILTCCEDVSAVSRFDTKLTNIKMPWEKKSAITIPLGSFNCWKMNQTRDWKLSTTLYFDCQVSALSYDAEKLRVILGLENGHIIFYAINESFTEFSLMHELAAHTDRVTGLVYNEALDILISCSRDKSLQIFHVGDRRVLSTLACGASWLSSMAYDPEHARVFLATYAQTILIVDVAKNPPMIAHTLTGHQASVRCLHYETKERYLFSGGFDDRTGIWDIQDAVSRSRSVGWLAGGPPKKVKSVIICTPMNLVITGCDDGLLAIWSTTGSLLHVSRAHKDAIVKLRWLEEPRVLLTGSNDGRVKFWQFPGGPQAD